MRIFLILAILLSSAATAEELSFDVMRQRGWNLISTPIDLDEAEAASLLGESAWAWNGWRLIRAQEMEPGQAYWSYEAGAAAHSTSVVGTAVKAVDLPLRAGWNLVGGIGYPPYADLALPLKTEPAHATSTVWGWDPQRRRYVRAGNRMEPGRGYWILVKEDCVARLSPNPSFSGVELAYASDNGKLTVQWQSGDDDRDDTLSYHLYATSNGAREAVIDEANRVATVTDANSYVLADLTPDAAQFLAVIAEDADGNLSWFPQVVAATPTGTALQTTETFLTIPSTAVGEVTNDGATIALSGNDAANLAIGDLLIVDDDRVAGLRRITGVAAARAGREVTTEQVSLGQVVASGRLRSTAMIDEPLAFGLLPADNSGARASLPSFGSFFVERELGEYTTGKVLFENLAIKTKMDFTPSFTVDAEFKDGLLGDTCESVRMTGGGEFGVKLALGFDFTGELAVTRSGSLLPRPVGRTFTYAVGGVPVVQELFLEFDWEAEIAVTGAISGEAEFAAATDLEFGFAWHKDTGWQLISDTGMTGTVEIPLETVAGVTGTFRLHPKLSTRFYKALKSTLHFTAGPHLDAEVQTDPNLEFAKFDAGFAGDLWVEANLQAFNHTVIGWESPKWRYAEVDWFTLPEIGLSGPSSTEVGEAAQFALVVTDGIHNAVPPENVSWSVTAAPDTPPSSLPLLETTSDGLLATLTAAEAGTFVVEASVYGDGFLGETGKRRARQTVEVRRGAGEYLVIDVSAGSSADSYPVETLQAIPQPIPDVYKTSKILLRRIPAGSFGMGSPEDEWGRHPVEAFETRHSVTLTNDFYVGVFEVTQKQWERVMGFEQGHFSNAEYRDLRPVENLGWDYVRGGSWPDGAPNSYSFLGVLAAKTGLAIDLPTEAQWEYACRAGTNTALNSGHNLDRESTGADAAMDAVGRYRYNSGAISGTDLADGSTAVGTAAVGSYAPNAWGLYDFHGNVSEWCLDWWDGDYEASAAVDPVGPPGPSTFYGPYHLARGGAWGADPRFCRSAQRHPTIAGGIAYGIRLAAPAGP